MPKEQALLDEQISSAKNLLRIVRQDTDTIGVAVSFGKDSLATLDLCCSVFKHVCGFYLYRVANLSIVNRWCELVDRRFGVKIVQYPHFDLVRCYKNSVFQPPWQDARKCPRVTFSDIDNAFRHDAGVEWIAYGWRRNDSFSRALIMKQCSGIDYKSKRLFPLRSWTRKQVYEYLRLRNIEQPPKLGRKEQGGLDFHEGALRELKDNYPQDWNKWITDFPFSEIQLMSESSTS